MIRTPTTIHLPITRAAVAARLAAANHQAQSNVKLQKLVVMIPALAAMVVSLKSVVANTYRFSCMWKLPVYNAA